MTATVMSLSRPRSLSSTSCARDMRSISVRPQVGQDTKRTPPFLRPAALSISTPARTSSTGSAVSETRIVSPMPSMSSVPMPTADFITPP